ncbi:unnamed protein product [Linum trigynum]|uniref:Tf2-1-like SH3-like domain-containing protein n=1 Tax=Linum trigynum TaxID=586398 RepID=A0AAV2F9K6_9ROSI
MVYLHLQPYKQGYVVGRHGSKLGPHYFGPYSVLAFSGEVAYHLDLPQDSQIHHVLHVSLLKLSHSIVPLASSQSWLQLPFWPGGSSSAITRLSHRFWSIGFNKLLLMQPGRIFIPSDGVFLHFRLWDKPFAKGRRFFMIQLIGTLM